MRADTREGDTPARHRQKACTQSCLSHGQWAHASAGRKEHVAAMRGLGLPAQAEPAQAALPPVAPRTPSPRTMEFLSCQAFSASPMTEDANPFDQVDLCLANPSPAVDRHNTRTTISRLSKRRPGQGLGGRQRAGLHAAGDLAARAGPSSLARGDAAPVDTARGPSSLFAWSASSLLARSAAAARARLAGSQGGGAPAGPLSGRATGAPGGSPRESGRDREPASQEASPHAVSTTSFQQRRVMKPAFTYRSSRKRLDKVPFAGVVR